MIPFIGLILQKVLIASIFEDFGFFFGVKFWAISIFLFEFISVESIEISGCFKEFRSTEGIIFLSSMKGFWTFEEFTSNGFLSVILLLRGNLIFFYEEEYI